MKAVSSEKRSVTPAQAIQILEKNGCPINKQQAEEILEIMYFLTKLIVNQNFKQQQE